MQIITRDLWLGRASMELGTLFEQAGSRIEDDPLVTTTSSCRDCAERMERSKRSPLGFTISRWDTPDGVNRIFISHLLADKIDVLGVLVHELCHVADDCESGHRGRFVRIARSVGLVGKPRTAHAGEGLRRFLKALDLPDYPATGRGTSGDSPAVLVIDADLGFCVACWRSHR